MTLLVFRMKSFDQCPYMRLDNSVTSGQLPLSIADAFARHGFQIIDIIQNDILEATHRRIDVARHGQIDEKQRAMMPRSH